MCEHKHTTDLGDSEIPDGKKEHEYRIIYCNDCGELFVKELTWCTLDPNDPDTPGLSAELTDERTYPLTDLTQDSEKMCEIVLDAITGLNIDKLVELRDELGERIGFYLHDLRDVVYMLTQTSRIIAYKKIMKAEL